MSEETTTEEQSTYIVIDTNEWIRLKWLGSPTGLALISIIRRDPGLRLAIPEVLNMELEKHRTDTAQSLLKRLADVTSEMKTITGDPVSGGLIIETANALEVQILQRIQVLAEKTIYPEITLAETRRALRRVNAETPPNAAKNQQMKDSLLWEACLTLASKSNVILVTGDKAFYHVRDPKNGLAKNLKQEELVQSCRLQVFPSLEEAIEVFAPDETVPVEEFEPFDTRKLIAKEARAAFDRSGSARDIGVEVEFRGVNPSYLKTEEPHVFAASFHAFFFVNKNYDDRPHGEAVVIGDGKVDTRTGTMTSVNLQSIVWILITPDGHEARHTEVFVPLS
ncbi:PIN domain-containing protein [Amycolatopsis sp. NPDC059657]|uniref:PIN domain-containing protein n=1 Tax=Amycolatopsis sp. NPDC059657 TaxID=3346899 RepID=UPI00366FA7E4